MSSSGPLCPCKVQPGADANGFAMELFPKWTVLVGSVGTGYEYYSEPLEVTSFARVVVNVVVGHLTGTVDVDIETSSDAFQWAKPGGDATATVNAPNAPVKLVLSKPQKWIRLTIGSFSAATAMLAMSAAVNCSRE